MSKHTDDSDKSYFADMWKREQHRNKLREAHDNRKRQKPIFPDKSLEELIDLVNEHSTPMEQALKQWVDILLGMCDDIEYFDDLPLLPKFSVGDKVKTTTEAPDDWYDDNPDCEWPSDWASVVDDYWYDTDAEQWRYWLADPNEELSESIFFEDELEGIA